MCQLAKWHNIVYKGSKKLYDKNKFKNKPMGTRKLYKQLRIVAEANGFAHDRRAKHDIWKHQTNGIIISTPVSPGSDAGNVVKNFEKKCRKANTN